MLDNCKWDQTIEGIAKKPISGVRLSFSGKNIIRSQILVFKLWYIGQIYKHQKENGKKNI